MEDYRSGHLVAAWGRFEVGSGQVFASVFQPGMLLFGEDNKLNPDLRPSFILRSPTDYFSTLSGLLGTYKSASIQEMGALPVAW